MRKMSIKISVGHFSHSSFHCIRIPGGKYGIRRKVAKSSILETWCMYKKRLKKGHVETGEEENQTITSKKNKFVIKVTTSQP